MVIHTGDEHAPYNVGKSRARAQLKVALSTEEEDSQLRRLNSAIDTNRYDKRLTYQLEAAKWQTKMLSRKLGYEPSLSLEPPLQPGAAKPVVKAKPAAAAADDEEMPDEEIMAAQEMAAIRIQSLQRGKHGRRQAEQKKATSMNKT
jgi:hypothetical protein